MITNSNNLHFKCVDLQRYDYTLSVDGADKMFRYDDEMYVDDILKDSVHASLCVDVDTDLELCYSRTDIQDKINSYRNVSSRGEVSDWQDVTANTDAVFGAIARYNVVEQQWNAILVCESDECGWFKCTIPLTDKEQTYLNVKCEDYIQTVIDEYRKSTEQPKKVKATYERV